MGKIKKIFISGVAGFLGSHLATSLLKKNYEVVGIDNFLGGEKDNIPEGVKFYNCDCLDFNKLNIIMKDVDVVYHCAATAHEGLSVFSPVIIAKNNYLATITMLSAGINNKVKRFIYCSSMARYGKSKSPYTENTEPMPTDPYGISKLAAEKVIINLCDLNKIDWVIAVPHNIIGPKQKYDDPYRNVVAIMINRMLQKKPAIIYGDGEQKRCFSYIDDCITCLLAMIDGNETNRQIFNIGPDEEYVTINKVAEICSNLTGFNLEPIYVDKRPLEVKHAICSSDKARKILNYKTKTDLHTGIKKTYEYIKKRGARKFNYNIDIEIKNSLTPRTWVDKLI